MAADAIGKRLTDIGELVELAMEGWQGLAEPPPVRGRGRAGKRGRRGQRLDESELRAAEEWLRVAQKALLMAASSIEVAGSRIGGR